MKIGRNDPCPCGSGKKYKRCHLNQLEPMTPEIYAEKFKSFLLRKYKILFDLNKELREVVDKMLDKKYPKVTKKGMFAAYAMGKAYKTHGVVLKICEDGYGEDAAMLVRSLFELTITLLYILKDDTDYRIDRYLDYDWILRHKMYEYAKTKEDLVKIMEERESNPRPNEDTREEVEKRAKDAQEKYKYKNNSWSDKSIKDMSDDVGRLSEYLTVYRLQSQIVHNATRTMNDYIKASPNKKGFSVEIGPTENWIDESLVAVFDFLYSIARNYDNLHKLGFTKQLELLEEKWVKKVDSMNKTRGN